jgi:hypothetical protein
MTADPSAQHAHTGLSRRGTRTPQLQGASGEAWRETCPRLTVSRMRGDEKRVVDAFVAWLQENSWTADTEVNFVDVYARRGDEHLYAEAKGRTEDIGLDIDTLYGQLLRRMIDPHAGARYAVVVPTPAVQAALRVPDLVRQRLGIDVYEVDDAGKVHPRE